MIALDLAGSLTCAVCGAYFHDLPAQVAAHRQVHGHYPRPLTDSQEPS